MVEYFVCINCLEDRKGISATNEYSDAVCELCKQYNLCENVNKIEIETSIRKEALNN